MILDLTISKLQHYVCPIDDKKFRFIHGQCLYYETRKLSYSEARLNCQTMFNGKGQLFEPRDLHMNTIVHKKGLEIFHISLEDEHWLKDSFRIWLGINSLKKEGIYEYDKTNLTIDFDIPWAPG